MATNHEILQWQQAVHSSVLLRLQSRQQCGRCVMHALHCLHAYVAHLSRLSSPFSCFLCLSSASCNLLITQHMRFAQHSYRPTLIRCCNKGFVSSLNPSGNLLMTQRMHSAQHLYVAATEANTKLLMHLPNACHAWLCHTNSIKRSDRSVSALLHMENSNGLQDRERSNPRRGRELIRSEGPGKQSSFFMHDRHTCLQGNHMDDKGGPEEAQLLWVHHTGIDLPGGKLPRGGDVCSHELTAAHGQAQ